MADDSITITIDSDSYDYDSIWKDFTTEFWRDVLEDFMPDLYVAADLDREAEQLDKELHELLADLEIDGKKSRKTHKRYVDNLLKIYLKDGTEEWVLLHIEIQGRGGENISIRMFRYQCLLFIRYGRHAAAMAILTAKRPKKEGEPGKYVAELFGTKVEFNYNAVKVYDMKDDELKARNTLSSLFIYALKKGAQSKNSDDQKLEYGREIMELLAKKGLDPVRRSMFMEFVENALSFSSGEYNERIWREGMMIFNEGVNEPMRRKGMFALVREANEAYDKGLAKGLDQGLAQGLAQAGKDTARFLLKLGTLTNEQIAEATKQSLEEVMALRQEIMS